MSMTLLTTFARVRPSLHIANTLFCFGLNLLIARLGIDPRWRHIVMVLVALNEIRGIYIVWQTAPHLL